MKSVIALIREVAEKKAKLARLRPLSPRALDNLDHALDLELTYTSNAIEGNSMTQIEPISSSTKALRSAVRS